MRCPFPGMDPYVEAASLWEDFHAGMMTSIRLSLEAQIGAAHQAVLVWREYVLESETPLSPPIGKGSEPTIAMPPEPVTPPVDPPRPVVLPFWRREVRIPVIEVLERGNANRVVTVVELLSPGDKVAGAGRISYFKEREQFWETGTNLVEVDLLRAGTPTVRLSPERLASVRPWSYLVAVTRQSPTRHEVYPIALDGKLPRVGVPLSPGMPDAVLDLQALFTACHLTLGLDDGHYQQSPPPPMTPGEIAWCRTVIDAQTIA